MPAPHRAIPCLLASGALLSAACSGTPDRLSDCRNPDCRADWVIARLDPEPGPTLEAILTLRDPVERALLVGVVVDRRPQLSGFFCDRLPPGPDRTVACDTTDRPHIWAQLPPAVVPPPRTAAGPPGTTLIPSAAIPRFPLAGTPAIDDPCADRPDRITCLLSAAWDAARRDDTRRAVDVCQLVGDGPWRAECFFRAAEGAIEDRTPLGYGDAVRLCAAAHPFSAQCYAHMAMKRALLAPRADAPGAEAWRDQIASAQELAELWADRDPRFGSFQVGLFWARSLEIAYNAAMRVTGDTLAVLPPEAVPHVRAAAAARLAELGDAEAGDLAGRVEALARALEHRGEAPDGPAFPRKDRVSDDFWPSDRPGDEVVPATYYRGVSRRAVAPDAGADLAICVLEDAARQQPPLTALLAEGRQHPDPLVRWTAERLAAAVERGSR